MRVFAILPALFAAAAIAVPTRVIHDLSPDWVIHGVGPRDISTTSESFHHIDHRDTETTEVIETTGAIDTTAEITEAEDHIPLSVGINTGLTDLGLTLNSTIAQLVRSLDLKALHDDIDSMLRGMVSENTRLTDKLEATADRVLEEHHLGVLWNTIADLARALGLSRNATISTMLAALGVTL